MRRLRRRRAPLAGRPRRQGRSRRGLWAAAFAIALFTSAQGARAQQVETPRGNLGAVLGARQNIGGVADDYRLGLSWGVRAGYHLAGGAQNYAIGGEWSLVWSRFGAASEGVVASPLNVLEMSFGASSRFRLSEAAPHFAKATAGATLYRASHAIAPDRERLYIGPYAGAGVDMFLSDEYLLSLEARYGLITGGPRSLLFLVGFSFGR